MLIWKDVGILAPIVTIGMLIVMQRTVNAIFSNSAYYPKNEWPKFLAVSLASSLMWLLDRQLNRSIYLSTKEARRRHAFFFIAFEHWAYIVAALGLFLYFMVGD